jgi:hypothetical protein
VRQEAPKGLGSLEDRLRAHSETQRVIILLLCCEGVAQSMKNKLKLPAQLQSS